MKTKLEYKNYLFKDNEGHKIENCQDYIDLKETLKQAQNVANWFYIFGCTDEAPRRFIVNMTKALKKCGIRYKKGELS